MSASSSSRPPLVTVVTPAYNVAKYVGAAADSVFRQTFSKFEYIVVDDGSLDDSVEVVRAHAGHDPRFRLIEADHGGPSAARNIAIRESRGKYIAFLDGDDRWHPRFLERQVGLIESLPANVGMVFCRSRMILENGTPVFFQWHRSGSYDFDDFLVGSNPARNGSSVLIRKSCFDDVGGFDEDLWFGEDLEMWLRVAEGSRTPVLWASPHFLVNLRLRPGSATRDWTINEVVLQDLLESHTPRLRRLPAGLAYVRPAVAALKYGSDSKLTERWVAEARSAGTSRLVRRASGLQLLFWRSLPPSGRSAVRSVQRAIRETLKSTNLRLRGGSGL
jgi:glycosyltransferase involved in cell wall biosynthesis